MSLWPKDYDRLYDYRCPADLSAALEEAARFPLPCPLPGGCPEALFRPCSTGGYQRALVFKGSAANSLSAANKAAMLNAILAGKASAARGQPCEPRATHAAELRRRARQERDAPFVPSLVLSRR
jgi:hypothetical protein